MTQSQDPQLPMVIFKILSKSTIFLNEHFFKKFSRHGVGIVIRFCKKFEIFGLKKSHFWVKNSHFDDFGEKMDIFCKIFKIRKT
jgi:hypothetical protein